MYFHFRQTARNQGKFSNRHLDTKNAFSRKMTLQEKAKTKGHAINKCSLFKFRIRSTFGSYKEVKRELKGHMPYSLPFGGMLFPI